MDRRRFIPSADGLETRALLSSFFGGSTQTSNVAATDVPVTWHQKESRVDNLPYFLLKFQSGRFLSHDVVTQLQTDMKAIIGQLHKADSDALDNFNSGLRSILTHSTLSAEDAATLSHNFEVALNTTGATPQQVSNLVNDMTSMAQVDSQSRQPVFLATNDYSTVLQTILGVGRPIQTPMPAQVAQVDGVRADTRHGITSKAQPRFVGTYGVGDTVGLNAGDPTGGFNSYGVTMQIVDQTGTVLGEGKIPKDSGNYVIKTAHPLETGTYTLYTRAVDSEGHMSALSPPYVLKVVAKDSTNVTVGASTPKGPASV